MKTAQTNRRPAVAVIGANEYVLGYADREKLEIILVDEPVAITSSTRLLASAVVEIDYKDTNALLPAIDELRHSFNIVHAFSTKEIGLVAAAKLGAHLNIGTTPLRVVEIFSDKLRFRDILYSAGLSPFKAFAASGKEDILKSFHELSAPVIAKPRASSGSFGIRRVSSAADVENVWRDFQDLKITDFIIEPFLEGPEISVEAFSFDGEHLVYAITDKFLGASFIERGHSIPSMVGSELKSELRQLTAQILDAAGLRNGPSHTEFKLTKSGPVVLESHNRTGGDMISFLSELACGVNPFSLAFGWQTGLMPSVPDMLRKRKYNEYGAAVRFFWPLPGKVEAVEGMELLRSNKNIKYIKLDLKPGDIIKPVTRSADRVGMVVAEAETAAQAAQICEEAIASVKIKTRAVSLLSG